MTVAGPSIWNRRLKDTWSWRACHQLHHKYGEHLRLYGCSLHPRRWTHNEYQVSALHVSGIGPLLLSHVPPSFWRPSDVYIYASSSTHNSEYTQNCVQSSTHQANGYESKTLVQRTWQTSNEWRWTMMHKPFFRALLVHSSCIQPVWPGLKGMHNLINCK